MKRTLTLLMILGLAACAGTAGTAARTSGPVLPFISNDYAAAVQKARAEKKPIFIESWAPW